MKKEIELNGIEFNKILLKIARNQVEEAIDDFEIYLKKYSDDVCAHLYYINLLLKSGNISKAEKNLDNIMNQVIVLEEDIKRLFYTKINLFICKGEYEKCCSYISENSLLFGKRKYDKEIVLFLKKKLGKITTTDFKNASYQEQQIMNYRESKALSHILKLQSKMNLSVYRFNRNFQLNDVFYKLREILPVNSKTPVSFLIEKSIFKYNNCGSIDGASVDYFIVYTNVDTNQIIEMYPYENKENAIYVDLNYLKEEFKKNHKSKVKNL